MSYKNGDISTTFDNQFVIHGLHCTLDEAKQFLLNSDYPDVKAIDVKHKWATWGRLPEEYSEYSGECGWWTIAEQSTYRHKKKMTFIVTEESKRIEVAIQRQWND